MAVRKETGRVSAVAPTETGWLYVSTPLTPYDVENLYGQFASLQRSGGGRVHVDVDLVGTTRNSPELKTLANRVKRLRRQGVVVRMHAGRVEPARAPRRGKLTPSS
jgi:hypothetical protein